LRTLLAVRIYIFHNEIVVLDVKKLKPIKMLVLDVDGVLTDCRIFMDSNGEWKRFFSIRDGVGIKLLHEAGYKLAIITGTKSADIQARAKVLSIDYFYEGALDKKPSFERLQKESGISSAEMAYMGDDIFDIPLLASVGFGATVP
jgi:3-deoxy-D-manno-octulosonate 8-phosphate phosphatase (KDO 8-P phosphatase)